MRQAVLFSGKTRIKISGIPDDFWRKSNWSVMALLKFKDIKQKFVRVLGHGSTTGLQGLHLGITDTKVKYICCGVFYTKVVCMAWYCRAQFNALYFL